MEFARLFLLSTVRFQFNNLNGVRTLSKTVAQYSMLEPPSIYGIYLVRVYTRLTRLVLNYEVKNIYD